MYAIDRWRGMPSGSGFFAAESNITEAENIVTGLYKVTKEVPFSFHRDFHCHIKLRYHLKKSHYLRVTIQDNSVMVSISKLSEQSEFQRCGDVGDPAVLLYLFNVVGNLEQSKTRR